MILILKLILVWNFFPLLSSNQVSGVQMEVFKVSTYFKRAWSVMIVESAAACPTGTQLWMGYDFG